MFKKILWATDGSESGDAALPVVKELARQNRAVVIVFHCEQQLLGGRASGYPVYIDETEVKEKIRGQAQALADEDFQATAEIVAGTAMGGPAHDIAEAADREGVDLIVVATRGHTAFGGLLLGSVTQRLLHISTCPVMVVPTPAQSAPAGDSAEAAVAAS